MPDPIDAILANAGSALDAMHSALDAIAAIHSRASSSDGTVHAEVDGDGVLRELSLPDNLTKLNATKLGNSIVEAAAAAATGALQQRSKIIESMQIPPPHLR